MNLTRLQNLTMNVSFFLLCRKLNKLRKKKATSSIVTKADTEMENELMLNAIKRKANTFDVSLYHLREVYITALLSLLLESSYVIIIFTKLIYSIFRRKPLLFATVIQTRRSCLAAELNDWLQEMAVSIASL